MLVSGLVGCAPSSRAADPPGCLLPPSGESAFALSVGAAEYGALVELPSYLTLEDLLDAAEVVVVGEATEVVASSTEIVQPPRPPVVKSIAPGLATTFFQQPSVLYTLRFDVAEVVLGDLGSCTDIRLAPPPGPFMDPGRRELLFLRTYDTTGKYHAVGVASQTRWFIDGDGTVHSSTGYDEPSGWAAELAGRPLDEVVQTLRGVAARR